jgi:hypothetical protein
MTCRHSRPVQEKSDWTFELALANFLMPLPWLKPDRRLKQKRF